MTLPDRGSESRVTRTLRWLRRWPAAVLAVSATVIVIVGYFEFRHEYPNSAVAQRLFSSLSMFTGGYVPPEPDAPATPPTRIAWTSMAAFLLTFGAALWVIVEVTSKRLSVAYRARRSRPQLVVVGSGETATAIVKSALAQEISTVLIAESSKSQAARVAEGGALVVTVPSVESCTENESVADLLVRAQNVVIATDSAPANLALREKIAPIRKKEDDQSPKPETEPAETEDFRSLIAVVHDPVVADTMRPAVLTKLTEEDVTCPAENVAEHVCHLIDAATTGKRVVDEETMNRLAGSITVQVIPVAPGTSEVYEWPQLAETIELWIRRLSWSRTFLNGGENAEGLFNPVVPITIIPADAPLPTDGLNIRIYAGGPQAVIAKAVEDRAALGHSLPELTILVADRSVARGAHNGFGVSTHDEIPTGHEWIANKAPMPAPDSGGSQVVVVDPMEVGLDARLVVDDINLQWARMFAQTYEFIFSGSHPIVAWEPGAPLGDAVYAEEQRLIAENLAELPLNASADERQHATEQAIRKARKNISDRYSNRYAVKHMLELLQSDFDIVRLSRDEQRCPVSPHIPPETVTTMATAEHKHWLLRTWKDRSVRPRSLRQRLMRHTIELETFECCSFANSGAQNFTFEELEDPDQAGRTIDTATRRRLQSAAEYNRRIVTETYPAIAARFGYAIVRKGQSSFPTNVPDNDLQWPKYHRRGKVLATKVTETISWTTESGDTATAHPGSWLIRDASGKQWCVPDNELPDSYEQVLTADRNPADRPVSEHVHLRVGTVHARPAIAGEFIKIDDEKVPAPANGWIVRSSKGEHWPVSSLHFSRFYATYHDVPSESPSA